MKRPHVRRPRGLARIPRPGPAARSRVERAIRILVAANIAAIGLIAVIVLFGMSSGPGTKPPQIAPRPSASSELIAMGAAHIPTTNACVLCHGSGGQVKTIPAILHPVEGWRRCLTCHDDENLGRAAPGHDGIAEEECLNCHKTSQTGPAITRPHAALADRQCLTCHGSVAHLPATMASSREADCVLCHKPATLPPPSYPHPADARISCRSCHRSAEAGALPIDHALRTDTTCLLCHEIALQAGASASPLLTVPGQSGLPPASTGPTRSAVPAADPAGLPAAHPSGSPPPS